MNQRVLATLAAAALVTGASACANGHGDAMTSTTGPAQPASVHVTEAEKLVTGFADQLAPGAAITKPLGDTQQDCTAPLTGQIYYSISRQFTLPGTAPVLDALKTVDAQLRKRGYTTADDYGSNQPSLRASNGINELNVVTEASSRVMRFNVDTQCGTS